jgi:dephospho-CoA kinase
MKVIGLAGRPGSGKSAVGRALARRAGVEWVDLDRVAWDVYSPETETYGRLVERFGREIVASDGTVDRDRLAATVFGDPNARRDLEAIVHPAVGEHLREILSANKRRGVGVLLVEGALLSTSPYVDRTGMDAVVWLEASRTTRRDRLRAAGRGRHLDRAEDVVPDESAVVIDAEGSIQQVSEQVWLLVSSLP